MQQYNDWLGSNWRHISISQPITGGNDNQHEDNPHEVEDAGEKDDMLILELIREKLVS